MAAGARPLFATERGTLLNKAADGLFSSRAIKRSSGSFTFNFVEIAVRSVLESEVIYNNRTEKLSM